jgi:hypothetical protein
MSKRKRRYNQPPVKGGRLAMPSCVIDAIEHEASKIAARYKVSRSWVIAATLAAAFGFEDQPSYLTAEAEAEKARLLKEQKKYKEQADALLDARQEGLRKPPTVKAVEV